MNKLILSTLLSLTILLTYPMNCFAEINQEEKQNKSSEVIKFYDSEILHLDSSDIFIDVIKGNNGQRYSIFSKKLEDLILTSKDATDDFKDFQWQSTLGYSLYFFSLLPIASGIFITIKEDSFLLALVLVISGAVIAMGSIFLLSDSNSSFLKAIHKYNREKLMDRFEEKNETNNKIEKDSNNIELLKFSFKF